MLSEQPLLERVEQCADKSNAKAVRWSIEPREVLVERLICGTQVNHRVQQTKQRVCVHHFVVVALTEEIHD